MLNIAGRKMPAAEIKQLDEANGPDRREIVDHIIAHRLANVHGAVQNFLELAIRATTELAEIRMIVMARAATYMRTPQKLSLNDILSEHEIDIRRSLGPYVDFELRLSPVNGLKILADADLLRALFSNLAINARDALEHSTTRKFVIETIESRTETIVRISDSGSGMSPEAVRRIMTGEKFTSKPGLHMGMGMTFIRDIVTGLGARMELKSAAGIGTTFTIYFPIAAQLEAPSDARDSSPAPAL